MKNHHPDCPVSQPLFQPEYVNADFDSCACGFFAHFPGAGKLPDPEPRRQLSFISGRGRDLPGQTTLFDVDGLD